MGSDKALIRFDGVAMAARVAGVLAGAGCDPVVAIGGDDEALADLGLIALPDRWPREGPLGGVITALQHFAEHDGVVVVACDLPKLSPTVIATLIDALDRAGECVETARATTDRPQPVCAVWRPRAVERLAQAFASGERRLLDVVSGSQVVEVLVDARHLVNVNTVDDLPG